jgi:hypothetical protein
MKQLSFKTGMSIADKVADWKMNYDDFGRLYHGSIESFRVAFSDHYKLRGRDRYELEIRHDGNIVGYYIKPKILPLLLERIEAIEKRNRLQEEEKRKDKTNILQSRVYREARKAAREVLKVKQ